MLRIVMAVATTVALAGCCDHVLREYAEADRATYEAIAPEYMMMVRGSHDSEGRPLFDEEQSERRQRLVDAWRGSWEQALGAAPTGAPNPDPTARDD